MALGQNMIKRKSGAKESGSKKENKDVLFKKEQPANAVKMENIKITMQPSKRTKIKKTKILLEGELNINHVNILREELIVAINTYDYVDVCLKNVTQLDLSCIQLLYIFRNTFSGNNKEITINADLPKEIKDVASNAGFAGLLFKKTEIRAN